MWVTPWGDVATGRERDIRRKRGKMRDESGSGRNDQTNESNCCTLD
jgi:hypothetical protein